MNWKRIVTGALLAPLLVILVNALMALVFFLIARTEPPPPPGHAVYPDPTNPVSYFFDVIFIFSIFGVPAALLTLVLLWIPAFFLLRKIGLATVPAALLLCVILSIPVILFFDAVTHGWLFIAFMFLHGIAVGLGFLWISGLGFHHRNERAQPGAVGNEGHHGAD
jgi:hypothetical protein